MVTGRDTVGKKMEDERGKAAKRIRRMLFSRRNEAAC